MKNAMDKFFWRSAVLTIFVFACSTKHGLVVGFRTTCSVASQTDITKTGHKYANTTLNSRGQVSKLQFKIRHPVQNKSKCNTGGEARVEAIQIQESERHAGMLIQVSEVGSEGTRPILAKKWMLAGAKSVQIAWLVFVVSALSCGVTLMLLCCVPLKSVGKENTEQFEHSVRDEGWASPCTASNQETAEDSDDARSESSDESYDMSFLNSEEPVDHSHSLAQAVRRYKATCGDGFSKK